MARPRRQRVDLRVPFGRLNGGRSINFPHRCVICCDPATKMRVLPGAIEDDRGLPQGARITNAYPIEFVVPYCTPHATRVDSFAPSWRRALLPRSYWKAIGYRPACSKVVDGLVMLRFEFGNQRYARDFEWANETWLVVGGLHGFTPSKMARRSIPKP